MIYLMNYEIKTWTCRDHIIGQKWNWCQSFQPLVMLLKLNDDKYYIGAEEKSVNGGGKLLFSGKSKSCTEGDLRWLLQGQDGLPHCV